MILLYACRSFESCGRYDYEGVESEKAEKVIKEVRGVVDKSKKGDKIGEYEVDFADDFEYKDPIDGSVASGQGLRIVFSDGSRIVFRCVLHILLLGVFTLGRSAPVAVCVSGVWGMLCAQMRWRSPHAVNSSTRRCPCSALWCAMCWRGDLLALNADAFHHYHHQICCKSSIVGYARRLSGTGSSGATIRMYIEQYSSDSSQYGKDASEALQPIINTALEMSKLKEYTGMEKPTVIT